MSSRTGMWKIASVVGVSLFLGACSNANPFVVDVINCPAVAVVGNTGSLTIFQGEVRDAENVIMNATISGIQTNCDQEDDFIESETSFNIIATRGPAMTGNTITVQYFVALLRDNFQITAKEVYETTLHFRPGQNTGGVRETLRQSFDDVDIARRYDYELLIGFQLSSDELAYNVLR